MSNWTRVMLLLAQIAGVLYIIGFALLHTIGAKGVFLIFLVLSGLALAGETLERSGW